mmetsp:Transcript_127814/g.368012  ORF Transcript_127814/g.368012 Transcript_127814/m.368012 type:complete len:293 (+) Transcript_127814:180-1058(+)
MPPTACVTRPSTAPAAATAFKATTSRVAMGTGASWLSAAGKQACEACFKASSRAVVAARIASTNRRSCGSSSSWSSSPKSKSSSESAPQASAPSSADRSRNASVSSRLASLICAKLMSIRLLVEARFCTDTRSKCLMRSNVLPTAIGMSGKPTEAPIWSMASDSKPPISRSSCLRQQPAPRRKESSVPRAAVKALMTSSATGFRAGSPGPSATAADAPNFVTVCCSHFATLRKSSGGTTAASASSSSQSLSCNSPRMSAHTLDAALSTWSPSAMLQTLTAGQGSPRPGVEKA